MSVNRFTLRDLHTAEQALARQHAKIDAGEPVGAVIRQQPGCERACSTCYLRGAIVAGCVSDIRADLAQQAAAGAPAWELRHGGASYASTAGRA